MSWITTSASALCAAFVVADVVRTRCPRDSACQRASERVATAAIVAGFGGLLPAAVYHHASPALLWTIAAACAGIAAFHAANVALVRRRCLAPECNSGFSEGFAGLGTLLSCATCAAILAVYLLVKTARETRG